MAADSNSPSQIVRAWLGGIRGGCPYRWFMSCSQSRGTPKVKKKMNDIRCHSNILLNIS